MLPAAMVHHLMLFKLKSDVTPAQTENIMVETRIRLLKIAEVMNLRCGKKIDVKKNPHDVFVSMDFENMSKLNTARASALWVQYEKQVIEPNVTTLTEFDYEMDPGKDVAYS
ncbi:MAG: Dabb family protein [Candidatus Methylacidiphilales bacterium]|nr:Dabb family protein [Candidatus Methylacidiphilales bacterium]